MLDSSPTSPIDSPAADRLEGIRSIADFLGIDPRQCLYRIERGYIPAGREGNRFVASKARLRAYWEALTAGTAAKDGAGRAPEQPIT